MVFSRLCTYRIEKDGKAWSQRSKRTLPLSLLIRNRVDYHPRRIPLELAV